jgi:hypothetical protein
VKRPVLSGTARPVLSGTRNPCYREPESLLTRSNTSTNRAPNFANRESYGFFLTSSAGCRSVENNDPLRRVIIQGACERYTLSGTPAARQSVHRQRSGNLSCSATIEVAP